MVLTPEMIKTIFKEMEGAPGNVNWRVPVILSMAYEFFVSYVDFAFDSNSWASCAIFDEPHGRYNYPNEAPREVAAARLLFYDFFNDVESNLYGTDNRLGWLREKWLVRKSALIDFLHGTMFLSCKRTRRDPRGLTLSSQEHAIDYQVRNTGRHWPWSWNIMTRDEARWLLSLLHTKRPQYEAQVHTLTAYLWKQADAWSHVADKTLRPPKNFRGPPVFLQTALRHHALATVVLAEAIQDSRTNFRESTSTGEALVRPRRLAPP